MIEHSPDWHSPDDRNLWVVQLLIERGASGKPVNIAFLKALDAFTSKHASRNLLDTLLDDGAADVNFRLGEALKIAIRGGDAGLLEELASRGASRETITHAFSEVILARLEEGKLLELIKVLVDREPATRPDFKKPPPNWYPIFDCLAAHPESVKLLNRLIELGCDVEAEIPTKLYDTTGVEPATALLWALSQPESSGTQRPYSVTITALIDAKGKQGP
jgi:hypothetical protein